MSDAATEEGLRHLLERVDDETCYRADNAGELVDLVVEIIENAGNDGIDEDEIVKAADALGDWKWKSALFSLWRNGRVNLRWDVAIQDFRVFPVETNDVGAP
ncbi:hypothetical protein [Mycobacterium persicum]|uniref:hypothetical protein n=1 Tax=Mycobacterium persicum TaxID=1487726 RepID=UPI0009F208B0|nr:hypothetical protein [Mycobacterium persicum]ORB36282.1 hypothetical protein BST40_24425 [Mycobacterium persicum]